MSIAIKRNFTIPSTSAIGASELYLTSSTASTTISTGTLTVAGGAGVSGVISLGGELKFFNGSFYTGFDSAATANTTYIWPATSPSTGTSVLSSDAAGNLSWILMSASGSGLTLNGLTATTQYFSTSISGSGFTIGSIGSTHTYYIALAGNASTGLISGAAQTIFGLKTFGSGVAITSGTASTNTTTGALTVAGGVGITGQLSVNTIALGTTAVSITPSMIFTGTAGTVITMSVISDTTLAWEGSSGQLFSIDNNLSSGEIFSVSDISGLPVITASAGQTITLNEFGGFTQVGNGLASTNTTTGALRVIGGVGISGTLNIGADLGISGLTTLTYTSEKLNTKTSAGSAGTVTHDLSTGSVFYHSSISNNFTANFTNVPTTNDRALGVTLILTQGGTAYMANVLQIDGTTQTIKWVNSSTPTGTANKVDIVGFSLIRTGSAWTVLGKYSTYG